MNDDHFVFSLHVNVSEELIREILSYGGDIQVVQPKKTSRNDTQARESIVEF